MTSCTCNQHNHSHLSVYAKSDRRDPTRTLTLRRQFSASAYKRFRKLKGVIRKAVIEQDSLGLRPDTFMEVTPPGRKAFDFSRSADKVQAFMDWLNQQQEMGVLEIILMPQIGQATEQPWTSQYIYTAYKKGIDRANSELIRAGYNIPNIEEQGGLDTIFSQPIHMERVGLLYTRTFQELKGITQAMDQQISRVLAQGLADGLNPNKMAELINDRVDKIGITRARTLARTETIRAHHMGMVQEYKNWGVEGVKVKAEWVTAGDSRVCEQCASLEGQIYTIERIEGMIPYHPNCRCISIPVKADEV